MARISGVVVKVTDAALQRLAAVGFPGVNSSYEECDRTGHGTS